MAEIETRLSPAGQARRDTMLQDLTASMRLHHRRRRRRRRVLAATAAIAACAALPALALLPALATPGTPGTSGIAEIDPSTPAMMAAATPAPPHAVTIRVVRSDASILERYAVGTTRSNVVTIDDGELLDTLAALDRPAGLVRDAAGVRLTRDVTSAAPPL